ncbi:MAG: hypothetical protein KIS76_14660 [Pyrinomonadaceae bacterium]|nr:hypothetical protein [Pyrinomonadaceae bacterium]
MIVNEIGLLTTNSPVEASTALTFMTGVLIGGGHKYIPKKGLSSISINNRNFEPLIVLQKPLVTADRKRFWMFARWKNGIFRYRNIRIALENVIFYRVAGLFSRLDNICTLDRGNF